MRSDAFYASTRSTSIMSCFAFSVSASVAAAAFASFFSLFFLRFSSCGTLPCKVNTQTSAQARAHHLLLGIDGELMPLLHAPQPMRLARGGGETTACTFLSDFLWFDRPISGPNLWCGGSPLCYASWFIRLVTTGESDKGECWHPSAFGPGSTPNVLA